MDTARSEDTTERLEAFTMVRYYLRSKANIGGPLRSREPLRWKVIQKLAPTLNSRNPVYRNELNDTLRETL